MELIGSIIAAASIPSALVGLVVWWFKRTMEKREKDQQEREKNREALMLMIVKSTKENTALCVAIAKAVQRIPDAKCNGDMTAALNRVEQATKEENDFLIKHGVHHLFE